MTNEKVGLKSVNDQFFNYFWRYKKRSLYVEGNMLFEIIISAQCSSFNKQNWQKEKKQKNKVSEYTMIVKRKESLKFLLILEKYYVQNC